MKTTLMLAFICLPETFGTVFYQQEDHLMIVYLKLKAHVLVYTPLMNPNQVKVLLLVFVITSCFPH